MHNSQLKWKQTSQISTNKTSEKIQGTPTTKKQCWV